MSLVNIAQVSRREPYLAGSPQYTPWEENSEHEVLAEGNPYIYDRVRDSQYNNRPSRFRTVFFLQPTGIDGRWGDWWAAAFLGGKVLIERDTGVPAGMFTLEDQRRNIAVPPTESYGDYVGEFDGVAPYGLD